MRKLKWSFIIFIFVVITIGILKTINNSSEPDLKLTTITQKPTPIFTPAPTMELTPTPTTLPTVDLESEGKECSKETLHFIVYYNSQDEACVNDMLERMESEFSRVCENLDYIYSNKVSVTIYSTMEELLEDNNIYGNIAGMVTGEDSLIVVSPLCEGWDYNEQLKVVIHEFIHLVVNHINWRVPPWLNEGIAYYECGQWELIENNFEDRVRIGNIPTFEDFGDSYNTLFRIEGWQAYVYTLIGYIIDEYGYDALRNYILNPLQYEDIFGLPKDQFWEKWVDYLENNY